MSTNPEDYILFYGHGKTNPTGYLSNFYTDASFGFKGVEYNTVEQFMHYQKAILFGDKESADKILNSDKPSEAKKLGRKVKGFDPKVWDEKKFKIVRNGVLLKFQHNPRIKKLLLKTDPKIIVEAAGKGFMRSPDAIWGIGINADEAIETLKNGTGPMCWGQNLLGKALMDVRAYLIKQDLKLVMKQTVELKIEEKKVDQGSEVLVE